MRPQVSLFLVIGLLGGCGDDPVVSDRDSGTGSGLDAGMFDIDRGPRSLADTGAAEPHDAGEGTVDVGPGTPPDTGPAGPQDAGDPTVDAVAPDPSALVMLDEVYHEVDGHRLALDVRVPQGPGPFPVVVIVHGGGFSSGDKSEGTAQVWGEYLPTVGFASVSVNYRLSGGMNGGARFPGPLQDVKCAVRWVRSRTGQLRLDADAIFSFGHSAGGYFATALATTGNTDEFDTSCPTASSPDSSVAAAVDYYGVTDFSTLASQRSQGVLNNAEQTLVGAACLPGNDTEACRVVSPLTYFDAEDPPIFALHADNDTTVPVEQSHQLRDEAGRLAVPFEYLEVQEFGHGWARRFSHPVIADARDQVVAWLRSR